MTGKVITAKVYSNDLQQRSTANVTTPIYSKRDDTNPAKTMGNGHGQ
jgi:hypothetical protein